MTLSTNELAFDTLAVRSCPPDPRTGALVPPIFQTTTYAQPAIGEDRGFTYSRAHNPSVTALEDALARLEGVAHCSTHATGMAAITALCLTTLEAGDRVVCSDVVYGGTVRLFEEVLTRFGVTCEFVDTADLGATAQALATPAKLVIIETPANPTLKLTDIAATAELAHAAGALLVVDNTFLTAVLQRPFALGADVVVYSTTKFIEGHNTTVGGALLVDDADLHARLDRVRKTLGSIQSPFDAWLTLKGLKTLPLRIREHSRRALEIARWLEAHPAVSSVIHPGLEGFSQRDLAKRQQAAGGGLIAFEVRGGEAAGRAFASGLELCTLAENLGALETLVTHPASMTHGDVPAAHRRRVGITDGLIRLSVGLEDPKEVAADLDQALRRAAVPEEVA